MPLVSRIITAPQFSREARAAQHAQSDAGIISERVKAREPRCRRRARLLAYALGEPTRKIAGNAGVFASPHARYAAFTQTLRALRIAHGIEARRRHFRAHGCGGMEKARRGRVISPAEGSRRSPARRLARKACSL